jgi:rSAM/selenodomain-associated transferase 2
MKLSIIIPTLNEEQALPATLCNITECAPDAEVIIVDGGSTDNTSNIVAAFKELPVLWLTSPRGRGNQMNAGATRATGDVILFLHADTQLPPETERLIEQALVNPAVIGGNFTLQFVPRAPLSDLYTWCYNARSRARIFYGDSAIFVRREIFEAMGGYRFERIMEDIDFVRRLRRRGRLVTIREGCVLSSARRFADTRSGLKVLWIWVFMHILLFFGAGQEKLESYYRQVR